MTGTLASVQTSSGSELPLSRSQINVIFGTIMLGVLLSALDSTIVSTALPTIVSDLGGAGHLSWVVTAYLLAETVSTALAGKFGDMFGRKRLFQVSALIFIFGSMASGLAQSMIWLVASRAAQGLGGGGLLVTGTALIGDVIPLRERGQYQGVLGSVFGVTTVVGPLLGGWFTDQLSWRWAFYINVPIGIVAVLVAQATLPARRSAEKPVIDYLGIIVLTLGITALTLALSWGGTVYAWSSPTVIGLFAGAALTLTLFAFVERRAKEPVLPLRLFSNSVFTVCALLSFIVGFAMLGALTFIPTYLQFVAGVSATASGFRMLPMVLGLLACSTASGTVVSRTGKYKIFPVVGSLVIALGLFLLSRMDQSTPVWVTSLYLAVLGIGIGLSMQVLTIIVQNTVEYGDLGVATSGVTFFRTIGSSFGAAVFGTVYTNYLAPRLATVVAQTPGMDPRAAQNPGLLHQLPAALASGVISVYAGALHTTFLTAVPVALVAFVLALFLKQVPMRGALRAVATDMGEGFCMPGPGSAQLQLEQIVACIMDREAPAATRAVLDRSGASLDEGAAWCVLQVYLQIRVCGYADLQSIADAHRVPRQVLEPAFSQVVASGHLAPKDGRLSLTASGQEEAAKLSRGWRQWLTDRLDDWHPAQKGQLDAALDSLARRLVLEHQPAARPVAV